MEACPHAAAPGCLACAIAALKALNDRGEPACSRCWAVLTFSARARGDGLCGPCSRGFDPFEVSAETYALARGKGPLPMWALLAELAQAVEERRDFVVRRSFGSGEDRARDLKG